MLGVAMTSERPPDPRLQHEIDELADRTSRVRALLVTSTAATTAALWQWRVLAIVVAALLGANVAVLYYTVSHLKAHDVRLEHIERTVRTAR
jgi:hypothetical protein